MKSFIVFFCCLASAVTLSVHAQTVPAATRNGLSLRAGVLGSVFQPDYAGGTGPDAAQSGPLRLYGIGAYVDVRFTRWVQIEAEGHWLRFNEFCPPGESVCIGEDSYFIGPRIPIHTFHRFTPYGKFLAGFGSGNSWLDGRAGAFTYGGGVDYSLNRRFTVRVADFEYQDWNVSPTLHPYGGSVGLSYRVF